MDFTAIANVIKYPRHYCNTWLNALTHPLWLTYIVVSLPAFLTCWPTDVAITFDAILRMLWSDVIRHNFRWSDRFERLPFNLRIPPGHHWSTPQWKKKKVFNPSEPNWILFWYGCNASLQFLKILDFFHERLAGAGWVLVGEGWWAWHGMTGLRQTLSVDRECQEWHAQPPIESLESDFWRVWLWFKHGRWRFFRRKLLMFAWQ